MKKNIIYSLVIIISFLISVYGKGMINNLTTISFSEQSLRLIYHFSWWVIPSVVVSGILFGFRQFFINLGLNKGFWIGLAFGLMMALPMLISSAILGKIENDISVLGIINSTFFAGFFEEFLFRGFLFGLLFSKLKWGFIPASILGGVVFGLGHLYQSSNLGESIGIFMITFIGALWFAWLYIEWDKNLWVPIFLHTFMNLSWSLFDVGGNALGDIWSNIFRATTIALTVIVTIKKCQKQNRFEIKRKNLWLNL